jgi:hypothetical protein
MGGGWKKVFLPTFLSLNTNFIPRTSNPPTIFEPNRPNIFHPVVMHMNEIQTIERLIPHDSQMLFQQNIRTQVRKTTYANSQTLNTDFLCRRSIPFQPMKCLHEHGQLMKRTHFA